MPRPLVSRYIKTISKALGLLGLTCLVFAGSTKAQAQAGGADDPTAHNVLPTRPAEEPKGAFSRTVSAICWYIPNRVMDVADIFRVHLGIGDGLGISVRATKFLEATYFTDDAMCFGWGGKPRRPPLFGEQVEERYFGFLAAHEGKKVRDVSEVGFSLHFAVIGVNFAVSLGEIVDAVTGVVGVDLAGDDHGPTMFDYTDQPKYVPAPEPITTNAPAASVPPNSALAPADRAPSTSTVTPPPVTHAPAANPAPAPKSPSASASAAVESPYRILRKS